MDCGSEVEDHWRVCRQCGARQPVDGQGSVPDDVELEIARRLDDAEVDRELHGGQRGDEGVEFEMTASETHIDQDTRHEASGAKWHEQTVAALDFETTGLDPLQDRIVQAALVFVEPDGTVSGGWSGIIDPGVPIPADATKVHGITTEVAQTQGVSPLVALTRLARLMNEVAARGIPLVMFNAPFDWTFLLAEAARHGVEIERVDIIDPLVCDRALDRYRRGKRTLEVTAQHYGCRLDGAHDAQADAVAAAAIARVLAARYPELGARPVSELQAIQEDWHAERTRSFAE